MKNTFTCEKGTEEFMEMILSVYPLRLIKHILKQAGVTPTLKFDATSDGFTKEHNYHVTMDVLTEINHKGFKYLGEKGLKEEADKIVSFLAEAVGGEVQIDPTLKQTCSDCGKEQHLDQFYKNKTKKLGVNNICKKCQKERNWMRTQAKPVND